MKRGFLLRAQGRKTAAKSRSASAQKKPQAPVSSTSADEPRPGLDVGKEPEALKLDYGNLSEDQKALPSDYDSNKYKINFKEMPASTSDYNEDTRSVTTIPQPVPNDETQSQWIFYGSTKAKVVNAPGFPARVPKPRRPDLCEVRSTPNMGMGLFAKHNIKLGDLVLAERPLLVAPRSIRGSSLPEHYTAQQIKQVVMREYEHFLEYAIGRLPSQGQADFRALHNAHTDDGSGPLFGIIRSNAYGIGNLFDGPHKTPNGTYQVVCKDGSRINHSCTGNVRYRFKLKSFSMQFYAVRDIKAGEELVYPYCAMQATTKDRQDELAPYGFVCKCPACVDPAHNTDKLRTTLEPQMARVISTLQNVDEAAVEDAVRLEKDIVKAGLHVDVPIQFVTLLTAICLGYARLGKLVESEKYGVLVEAYQKCFNNDE